ncbi:MULTISPECIES: phage tail tape measure protein [Serratia]|uniref:Phage tail tape measure protein n=1 Tax=Serratia marcescens TaxID=615 RepID=A0ABD6HYN5_SERMA|nr:phage tail tape measure protein [Serratia marcescens]MVF02906.1 phage tail tape measure protein [Serratia marcescens]
MKELAFLLSLKNNLSAPLGQAQKSVESFAKKSGDAFKQVATGAAGLWGVVQGVKGLLGPANEVQQALNELSTRGVGEDSLEKMYKSAQRFSTAYGKSAAEFIASGTIIKSELAGLADSELPRAAMAINTLAVASKSSAEQAAGYMSEMANNYRSTVRAMGNVPFADMMASKGAYMVKNFGTSLDEIRELVKSSKGTGTQYGAGMDEQLAVLGLLSKTQGTEAGGIYDSFLKSAVEGGKQLGMSFTDAQGKLLQFPDILQKLQAKFGDNIEGNVKAQATLNKAFGEGAQALTAAWGQADALRKHMRDMGNTQGLDKATQMAMRMANIWERVDKVWERIRVAIGMRLIPAIQPLIDYAINAGTQFAKWLDMFPNIARWIGYISLGTLALAAAGASVNVVLGVTRFIATGLMGIFGGLKAVLMAVVGAFAALTAPVILLIGLFAALVIAVVKFWHPIKAFITGFISGFGEAAGALAPLAPLFELIGTALGWVWQQVKNLFGWFTNLLTPIQYTESELSAVTSAGATFGRIVAGAIGLILTPLEWVIDACRWLDNVFAETWASITLGWEMVVNFFSGLSPVKAFSGFVDAIGDVFSGLWDWLMQSFGQTYNWIVSKLNMIPGVDIDLKPVGDAAPDVSGLAGPAGLNAPQLERGGIAKTITSSGQSKVTDNSRKIGQVNIYPQNGETFDALMESRELAAG